MKRGDKSICLLNTGGTIGMKQGEHGFIPEEGYLEKLLQKIPELGYSEIPAWETRSLIPLLDSANMKPSDWLRISRFLLEEDKNYDGFVILHGTDTMAYSASAVSFLLQDVTKPILFTGSQIPLSQLRNDASENLLASLLLAAEEELPEIGIFFGGQLFRGCRATKTDASSLQAFSSPNYPLLAEAGIQIRIHKEHLRKKGTGPLSMEREKYEEVQVGSIRLFPGISASFVENVLRVPLKGLVIEAYGVGNMATCNTGLIRVLKEAVDRGVVLVVTSQCQCGYVDLSGYATGAIFKEIGAISGADMTVEAALTKLHYLLASGHDPAVVRKKMVENLAGELGQEEG
ncbi:MAG: asparaginase [Pirellulaceae bacterium]|nr:asparaginase [Pirellulaceae bacterium]